MLASAAAQSREALPAIASSTGRRSGGDLEMTRRISAVAVCCSCASVSARCSSACGAPDGPLSLVLPSGTPHARQNLACEGLSCLHPGHVMPEPPSGRCDRRSEPWAETNRPGLVWSRTRSAGSPVQLAGFPRSWLTRRASADAGAQSRRCPYGGLGERAGARFGVEIVPALLHCRPP